MAALSLAACGGGEKASSDTSTGAAADSRPVTIKGSDTMVILGQRFAEEYMKRNPGVVVQVNGGGSGTGIAALINGTVDLAQASRPMSEKERQQVRQNRNADVVETPVALDSLAVFVHSSNAVQQLTLEQIKNIYQGRTKNWSEVGGANAPIVIYGRESSSGTYDYFKEHVLNKEDFAPGVQTLAGTAAIINAVSKDPNGIGYGGIAYADTVKALPVSAAGKPAVAPNEATVADSSYPLSRKLFFYTLTTAPERVTAFVEWVISPDGQGVVKNVGYFPLAGPAPEAATASPGASPEANVPAQ
jgi:phosphate transport system substrate-binding protein